MSDVAEAGGPQAEALEPAAGLDAIISGAIEKSGYGDDTPKPETSGEEQTPDLKVDATGRVHAPDGKFAPKKPAEAEPSLAEPAKPDANPEKPLAAEPALAQPVEPHARWSPELKAEFAKWPPDVQKAFRDRHDATEADYTRKTQELAETRKGVEPLLGEVKRLEPLFQQWQTTPQDFIQRSVNVVSSLTSNNPQDRVNTVAGLVQSYRVPLDGLLQALGIPLPQVGENGQATIDPTTLQLRQQVQELATSLHSMREQATLQERQRAQAEFDALGQTKDDSGQAKFPHFERVKQTMIQLVANNQAETWDQAYSKAVRLDDDLYKQTVEAERVSVQEAAEKARLEAVEKAKKTAPVKTSSAPPGGATQLKGLDAHLGAAMERVGFGN
jgi:hypothetical protein